jgi:hypothetical protein
VSLSFHRWLVLATLLIPLPHLTAGPVSFSTPSTVARTPIKLEMTSSQNALIRFTTDGSEPTAQSTLYKEPLTISKTTVLRAAAFDGTSPDATSTRTLIFLENAIHQNGAGFPRNWGTKDGKEVPSAYAMNPDIVTAPAYRNSAAKSLQALPSVSIVLPLQDLFGNDRGIYSHPEESGEQWERRCSFELINPGQSNIQVDCGIRIQGGWNRRPEESPKHSFRLVFKKKYGAGKLHAAIFGKDAPAEFDSLILRSGCNNSWLHWSGIERKRGELIRDQWMRDTFREMGHPTAAGIFVHLYLNGLYWGIYNLTERPDAAFAASHLGGLPRDYDSFNAEKLIEGTRDAWTELMNRLHQLGKSPAAYLAVAEMLNLQSFADYMIVNLYGANADWDRHSNWYAARRRVPPGKFLFFIWDAERTLEDPLANTIDFTDDESPPGLFHRLIENSDFRALFSERAKYHLQTNGALTPNRCAARYKRWSDQLDLAIIAESARWGNYRRDIHQYKEGPYELYTRDTHWRPEVHRLLNDFFPKRTAVLLDQFRAKSLLDR